MNNLNDGASIKMTTKIAFPTDDGQTISAHFGRAQQFLVVTLQDGREMARERRDKPAHKGGHHHGPQDSSPVRLDAVVVNAEPAADHGHGGMFAQLADCQVLIAGGMGQPAYDRAQAQGMTVFTPSLKQIDEALAAYVAGTLESDTRRVHAHGHGHDHAHD